MPFGFYNGESLNMPSVAKTKIISTDTVKRIALITGLYQYQIKKVLIATVQCIVNDLSQGHEVHFLSLGKFKLKHQKTCKGFNVYRREPMQLKERFVPKFIWGKRAYEFIRSETTKNLIKRDH